MSVRISLNILFLFPVFILFFNIYFMPKYFILDLNGF